MRRHGRAEIKVPPGPKLLHVLLVDRLVQAVALLVLLNELWRSALTEERVDRAPGQRTDPEEDENREPEENRDEKQQPADDVSEHLRRRPPTVAARSRSP